MAKEKRRRPEADDEDALQYQGFGRTVNRKPAEGIQLWASDWHKEHFGFYAWIDEQHFERDIPRIETLILKLNWRDGDVYTELINHTPGLRHFYDFLYDRSELSDGAALEPVWWRILEEKGDEHFRIAKLHLRDGALAGEVGALQYGKFENMESALEGCHSELYNALKKASALSCFDIRRFYQQSSGIYFDDEGGVTVVRV